MNKREMFRQIAASLAEKSGRPMLEEERRRHAESKEKFIERHSSRLTDAGFGADIIVMRDRIGVDAGLAAIRFADPSFRQQFNVISATDAYVLVIGARTTADGSELRKRIQR